MLSLSSLHPPQIGFLQDMKKTQNTTRTVSERDLPSAARSHIPDITVVLPFIRMMKNQKPITRTKPVRVATFSLDPFGTQEVLPYKGKSSSSPFRSLSRCIHRGGTNH